MAIDHRSTSLRSLITLPLYDTIDVLIAKETHVAYGKGIYVRLHRFSHDSMQTVGPGYCTSRPRTRPGSSGIDSLARFNNSRLQFHNDNEAAALDQPSSAIPVHPSADGTRVLDAVLTVQCIGIGINMQSHRQLVDVTLSNSCFVGLRRWWAMDNTEMVARKEMWLPLAVSC
jgi:hypothetical protein